MGYWRTNIFPHRYAAEQVLFVQAILDTIRRDCLRLLSREKVDILGGKGNAVMSEARDRKMKRKRKLDELKAEKVLRACRSRRAIANQL